MTHFDPLAIVMISILNFFTSKWFHSSIDNFTEKGTYITNTLVTFTDRNCLNLKLLIPFHLHRHPFANSHYITICPFSNIFQLKFVLILCMNVMLYGSYYFRQDQRHIQFHHTKCTLYFCFYKIRIFHILYLLVTLTIIIYHELEKIEQLFFFFT